MVRHIGLSALLAATCVAPAAAQQMISSPSDNIVVTGQEYNNKVVCRYEQDTGSRFQKRTCHTNKEWDDIREAQLRVAKEMFNQPEIETCGDSPCGPGAPRQ